MKRDKNLNGLNKLSQLAIEPFIEIYLGFERRAIPWLEVGIACTVVNTLMATQMDTLMISKLGLPRISPTTFLGHAVLILIIWAFVLYAWGVFRMILKKRLTARLTDLFCTANLKSPTGKLPSLIFDQPIDEWTRKLRLKKYNFPKENFVSAKPFIESGLQIYIDEVRENREAGTIDFIYSHHEMPRFAKVTNFVLENEGEFLLGQTRARTVSANFQDVPHLLIGGQTGGGKSTFLRQLITSLYVSNKDYTFNLVDLKGGLEFQLFENLPRVQVLPNSKRALDTLRSLEKTLGYRFEILKANACKDLAAFLKTPEKDRVYPEAVPSFFRKLGRTIVVIDEAAELFMAGDLNKSADVQEARRLTAKLAAQGRAAGIHLIIATQKPDVKAIDSHIKTNLTGIVSFQMPNLGSSMSILSSGRAADLPSIPGRAIWKCGLDQIEIQTQFSSVEQVETILNPFRSSNLELKGAESNASEHE